MFATANRPVPPVLMTTLSEVSLTVSVQGGLKTQLIAGALTLTTFNGAAATNDGSEKEQQNQRQSLHNISISCGSALSALSPRKSSITFRQVSETRLKQNP